jgi:hypothetical protein
MKTLKKYTTPKMEIMDMGGKTELLSGSNDSWWVPPDEPEEGCESAWHCGGWGND